jgi:hypothetical protein
MYRACGTRRIGLVSPGLKSVIQDMDEPLAL